MSNKIEDRVETLMQEILTGTEFELIDVEYVKERDWYLRIFVDKTGGIDLDDCGLTVIKSGAAATIIRHRDSVLKITSPTFPIGIYETSEVFVRDCEFESGDIIIMFSDGISENAYPFVKELLLGGSDIKHIVEEISGKAQIFNPGIHSDDVTVIGVRVTG